MAGLVLLLIKFSIFIIIPLAAILYFTVLFIFKEFNNEDLELVKKVLKWRK